MVLTRVVVVAHGGCDRIDRGICFDVDALPRSSSFVLDLVAWVLAAAVLAFGDVNLSVPTRPFDVDLHVCMSFVATWRMECQQCFGQKFSYCQVTSFDRDPVGPIRPTWSSKTCQGIVDVQKQGRERERLTVRENRRRWRSGHVLRTHEGLPCGADGLPRRDLFVEEMQRRKSTFPLGLPVRRARW